MITRHKRNFDRRKNIILKATNNGKCWWLYQMLTYRDQTKKEKNGKI